MIKFNYREVKLEQFGDGTLKCKSIDPEWFNYDMPEGLKKAGVKAETIDPPTIYWAYDNDAELFALCCLVDDLREKWPIETRELMLVMPYIPHARQDRNVSDRMFTLKTFAKIINSLNFTCVVVIDPHSDVSTALIDRVKIDPCWDFERVPLANRFDAVMFPDAGAAKKYSNLDFGDKPIIIGNKHRNKDGRIESYDLMNFPEGENLWVVIYDDICSYGGTFVEAAKALKARGVKYLALVVSHCENNILKGEVFDYFDEVFTTDSICTIRHPKLDVWERYRNV